MRRVGNREAGAALSAVLAASMVIGCEDEAPELPNCIPVTSPDGVELETDLSFPEWGAPVEQAHVPVDSERAGEALGIPADVVEATGRVGVAAACEPPVTLERLEESYVVELEFRDVGEPPVRCVVMYAIGEEPTRGEPIDGLMTVCISAEGVQT